MIICDICNRKAPCVDSIVLYNTRVDYCKECKKYASKLKKVFENNMEYYNTEIKKMEFKILNNIRNERRNK